MNSLRADTAGGGLHRRVFQAAAGMCGTSGDRAAADPGGDAA